MLYPNITQLSIKFPTNEYPIYIGSNLLNNAQLLCSQVIAQQVLIVTNETVAPIYLDKVKLAFTSLQCDVVTLDDGEMYKNQSSLNKIYDTLIQQRHSRDTTLFALGGGVVGDITGFAASTYQRGVRFVQVPTTLLAQVDSSVGGKTAINHAKAKNMIGSFYQPHAVIMDLDTLETLPEREFRAGLAEVIKYGLLVGGEFHQSLIALLNDGLTQKSITSLTKLIAESCQIKALFVQDDEREQGRRVLLNLGHTFAHALESVTNYQRWLHGEAVSIGLYCAALLSHHLGHITQLDVEFVDSLLSKANLPSRIPCDINLSELQNFMLNDKKIKNKNLPFVLMRNLGDCYLETKVQALDVALVLNRACA